MRNILGWLFFCNNNNDLGVPIILLVSEWSGYDFLT